MGKRQRKPTITQQITKEATENLQKVRYDKTRKQYIVNTKRFIKFCREEYNCKSFDDCRKHIQDYANYLMSHQYSPSTIHTYIVAVCTAFHTPLEEVKKPKRKVSEYTRGRNESVFDAKRKSRDLFDAQWSELVEFQKRVGIRRNELKHLCGRNLKYDESNHLCVEVECGKGRKYQLQRILPQDEEFIKSCFDGKATDEKIFPPELFNNDLNLHYLRAEHAKEYYNYELQKIRTEPGYREQLEAEIRKRWELYNIDKRTGKPKKFNENLIRGYYCLRGDTRKMAIKKGLPVKYDKLATLATSIFALSHWRLNVCIHSYLLA
ncbi:MAG: hypothetical protein ACI4W6_01845 [Acutalibacteraceae bacterium]